MGASSSIAGMSGAGMGGTSSTTAGTAGAGMSGASAAGASSGVGGFGGMPSSGLATYEELPSDDESAECPFYASAPDAASACVALSEMCQTTLKGLLADIEQNNFVASYSARVGCGVTEIVFDSGMAGRTFVFDQNGALVGFLEFNDIGFGPCSAPQYARGLHLGDCADVHECPLAADAAETGKLCAP
jgi:hypothetical protein